MNKIKNLRINSNMTQVELGKRLDVTQNTISAYECGRIVPPTKALKILSKIFACSIEELLSEGEEFSN